MFKSLFTIAFLNLSIISFSQVGIGTDTPDPSSILDVRSNNKGLLLPKVNLISVNDATTITKPAKGLMIYNLTLSIDLTEGYYYNSGTPSAPVWAKLQNLNSTSGSEVAKLIYTGTGGDVNKTLTIGNLIFRYSLGVPNGQQGSLTPQVRLRNAPPVTQNLRIGVNQQFEYIPGPNQNNPFGGYEYANNTITFTNSDYSTFKNVASVGAHIANAELNVAHIVDPVDNSYFRVTFYVTGTTNYTFMIIAEKF